MPVAPSDRRENGRHSNMISALRPVVAGDVRVLICAYCAKALEINMNQQPFADAQAHHIIGQ